MYSFCQILLFGFTDKGGVCVPFIRFCVDLCRGKKVCSFNEIQLNLIFMGEGGTGVVITFCCKNVKGKEERVSFYQILP